jgi:hypothetical protein
MDMIEHFELPRASAEQLYCVYITWFEDFESGFAEGIYDAEPDEDARIAYEFATGQRGDRSAEIVRLPWHAAVAIDAGVSSYLGDLETGLADGTYEDDVDPGVHDAAELLTAWLQQADKNPAALPSA